jgi:dTDP-4-dehydrorhamnose reductase
MLLITGANGQLGQSLQHLLAPEKYIATDIEQLDITNENAVFDFVNQYPLSAIINCAAYTNVDRSEEEPSAAIRINVLGPAHLAKAAAFKHIPLVHISTDYVFDGKHHLPLKETDPVRPLGVYGQTKLDGEQNVLKYAETAVILRTAWMHSPYGENFVKNVLRRSKITSELHMVADQFGTPTYAPFLAQTILEILPRIAYRSCETYHLTNEGTATWYDFAYYILQLVHSPCKVLPIHTAENPARALRPSFGVLDKTKFKNMFDITIPHWTQGVKACVEALTR